MSHLIPSLTEGNPRTYTHLTPRSHLQAILSIYTCKTLPDTRSHAAFPNQLHPIFYNVCLFHLDLIPWHPIQFLAFSLIENRNILEEQVQFWLKLV